MVASSGKQLPPPGIPRWRPGTAPLASALLAGLVLLALGALAPAARAQDAKAQFVSNCGTCHAFAPDAGRRAGPNLWGVYGREAGAVEDFPYSDALATTDILWSDETLDAWLTDSAKLIPGSIMNYRQPDPAVRQAIIEHLKNGNS